MVGISIFQMGEGGEEGEGRWVAVPRGKRTKFYSSLKHTMRRHHWWSENIYLEILYSGWIEERSILIVFALISNRTDNCPLVSHVYLLFLYSENFLIALPTKITANRDALIRSRLTWVTATQDVTREKRQFENIVSNNADRIYKGNGIFRRQACRGSISRDVAVDLSH